MSKRIISEKQTQASRLITAINTAFKEYEKTEMPEDAQFDFNVVLKSDGVVLKSDDFDMEYDVPFDDDLIANEAEIIVYNLADSTINQLKNKNYISLTSGYGDDTGVIFEGYISKVHTKREGVDRVTTINALDDVKYSPKMMSEKTYSKGTKASRILKDLLSMLGIPIEVFSVERDFTFEDETKLDGNIVENIKKYSDICGVSTYVYKQRIYCRKSTKGDDLRFNVNVNTGMIGSPEPFEEEKSSEKYTDTVHGYEITMTAQHRMRTAGIVKLDSINYSGEHRVQSGVHSYDGLSATTKIKCIEKIDTTVKEEKKKVEKKEETKKTDTEKDKTTKK